MENKSSAKRGKGKAVILLLFIIGTIVVFQFTPLKEIIAPEKIKAFIQSVGPWGPAVFIASYATGVCLFLPAILFTGIGAVLFGPYYGFLFNEIGALLGASAAFHIGRYLGRDFAASLIGGSLKKYDDKIAENGFATTLYLRLIFFPFTPLNFGMGLTKISFKDFFFGTLLGIIVGGFVLTFFFANLADVWASGDWTQLLNKKSLLSLAMFIASFFIPAIVKRIKPQEEVAATTDLHAKHPKEI